MRNKFHEDFEKQSKWMDKMIKLVFYTAFFVIILTIVAYIIGGAVIVRMLQNLGFL